MRSETPYGALCDIQRNIQLALSFITGHSFETFHADRRTVYAVIRCLEIISEASRRLPIDLKARHPGLPWSDITAAGNVYRHDYEDILDDIIWRTVQRSLQPLAAAVSVELVRLSKT